MLNDAIKRQGNLKVNVIAILNDATGTLVKGAYDDSRTGIGLILGTGCNGAYLEDAERVINWVGDKHNAKEADLGRRLLTKKCFVYSVTLLVTFSLCYCLSQPIS